jgi:hypothetical protein
LKTLERRLNLRDDAVDIDLPTREEIERALNYLQSNKAAGEDFIAVELLKNGGSNLVDELHETIQQAWISETLPRSWTEGVLCPVNKKSDKLDCKNYRGICLLNVTYKVFAKILYDRLLINQPMAPTILERGLSICGLRPNHVCEVSR